MVSIFEQILHMSFQAGIAVCIVLAVRLILKKSHVPCKYIYMLWLLPLIRMICPVFLESRFSMVRGEGLEKYMPWMRWKTDGIIRHYVDTENGIGAIEYYLDKGVNSGMAAYGCGNTGIHHIADAESLKSLRNASSLPLSLMYELEPMQFFITVGSFLWLVGIFILLIYSVVSVIRLKKKLVCSLSLNNFFSDVPALKAGEMKTIDSVSIRYSKDRIFVADGIDTAFVYGMFKPKIYLPPTVTEGELSYVIAHEQMHIRRGDQITKMLVFIVTAIHWFNPLAWVAFVCFTKDMEMACDEMVMGKLGDAYRETYAETLFHLTANRQRLSGVPLAFGEGDTKGRIRHVLKYKKPASAALVMTAVIAAVLVAGLLTDPKAMVAENYELTKEETAEREMIVDFFKALYDISAKDYQQLLSMGYDWDRGEMSGDQEISEVVSDMPEITADIETWFEGRYQKYFTEKGFEIAMKNRKLDDGIRAFMESTRLKTIEITQYGSRTQGYERWYRYVVVCSGDSPEGSISYTGGLIYFSEDGYIREISGGLHEWENPEAVERIFER